jgi:hypothetical protein
METSFLPVKAAEFKLMIDAYRAFEQGGILIVPHLL